MEPEILSNGSEIPVDESDIDRDYVFIELYYILTDSCYCMVGNRFLIFMTFDTPFRLLDFFVIPELQNIRCNVTHGQ